MLRPRWLRASSAATTANRCAPFDPYPEPQWLADLAAREVDGEPIGRETAIVLGDLGLSDRYGPGEWAPWDIVAGCFGAGLIREMAARDLVTIWALQRPRPQVTITPKSAHLLAVELMERTRLVRGEMVDFAFWWFIGWHEPRPVPDLKMPQRRGMYSLPLGDLFADPKSLKPQKEPDEISRPMTRRERRKMRKAG